MDEVICKIFDEANFFEQQGYEKTASQTNELAIRVEQKKIRDVTTILGEVLKIGNTFSSEFEALSPFGAEYRKKCVPQTQLIVFGGLMAMDKEQLPPPEFLINLIKKMNAQDDYINALNKSLAALLSKNNRTPEESQEMFRDACIIYEKSIEGSFSSAAKIMYFLMQKMDDCITEANETQTVMDICSNLQKAKVNIPVFLENWPEKNHIRNAIAHAQNQYDPILDRVHFVNKDRDDKITYESPVDMTFEDFFEIWMQVADAIDSLRYSMRIYGVFQTLAMYHFRQQAGT
ncbi:MAG: hypothetical protein CW716_08405 [Candidatus Bathyarchaeum sp.]|nr:MAG: hypothetical protein CW716_08405 [Candidatus Bathyarchaeum sp.]